MNIVGIIPARGGSKRLPGKNIKLLAGKPLIAHTIETAQKSKYINKMIPMPRFPLEKNRCEHRNDNQSYYFLNHFELHQ